MQLGTLFMFNSRLSWWQLMAFTIFMLFNFNFNSRVLSGGNQCNLQFCNQLYFENKLKIALTLAVESIGTLE